MTTSSASSPPEAAGAVVSVEASGLGGTELTGGVTSRRDRVGAPVRDTRGSETHPTHYLGAHSGNLANENSNTMIMILTILSNHKFARHDTHLSWQAKLWFHHCFCEKAACLLTRIGLWAHKVLNTLRPRQNGRHFPDGIFKCMFLNENVWIAIEISLKFIPKGLINNIPALVQIMAWRRTGDKPLSEPMLA